MDEDKTHIFDLKTLALEKTLRSHLRAHMRTKNTRTLRLILRNLDLV